MEQLLLPLDVVVAKEVKPHAEARMCGLETLLREGKRRAGGAIEERKFFTGNLAGDSRKK